SRFRRHLGPRYSDAGLRIEFHSNQTPGIHFKTAVNATYRESILKGLQDGLALRFPDLSDSTAIWIVQVDEHPVDSSSHAFYQAARMTIDQVYLLTHHDEA